MAAAERSERLRLKASLKKLAELRASDLSRDDLQARNLSFRSGLSYFERTLGLFRAIAHSNLSKVPSEYIRIVADHAERALAQFEEVLRFDGHNLVNPFEVRNHLIAAVRDYYRELHDDLSILVTHPPGQQERSMRPAWYAGAPLAILLIALFAAGVGAAYHYGLIGFAMQDALDSIHAIVNR